MTKLVLDDISTGYGSTTKLNSNFDAIEDALDNTLSRDGSAPNNMLSDLDMNSQRILNLPSATTNTEPVTYSQFLAAQGTYTAQGWQIEEQTATAAQTLFTLTGITYTPGTGNIGVYINGVRQHPSVYSETSASVITFSSGVTAGDKVLFEVLSLDTAAGTIASSLVTFLPPGTGGVSTNLYNRTSLFHKIPQDFGAVGDGVTDDSAKLQAAINACISAGGKELVLPAGNYKVTSPLQITVGSDANNLGFTIRGEAPHQTKITYSGTGYCFTLGTGLPAGSVDAWFVTIKDLAIHGSGASCTGAIKFNGSYFCRVQNVGIRYFNNAGGRGIFFAGTGNIANYHNIIDHVYHRDCATGIYMDSDASGIGANSNFVRNSWFGGHSAYAIHINGGDTNVIEQNEFNGGTTTAIYIENDANDNKILCNQFDGPTVWVNIASAACNNTLLMFNTGGGNGGQFTLEYLNSGTNTQLYSTVLGRITVQAGLQVGGPGNNTNAVPLTVIAPASLSTDAFRVNNSAGSPLFQVNSGGAITAVTGTLTGNLSQTNTNGNSILHSINATGTPATVLANWKQASGQTANVLEVRNTSDVIEFRIAPKGFLEFLEQTDPAAPASNRAVLYSRDNGSGKTQLCVRFPTGAVQVLATEP
jgi:hypothetical protein